MRLASGRPFRTWPNKATGELLNARIVMRLFRTLIRSKPRQAIL
jgi:hypothetical protein